MQSSYQRSELEVPELKIGPHGAGLIADMLISNCTLTSLNLSSNWLAKAAHSKDVYPAGGPVAIAQALRRNYQLRQLSFRRCDLASESLQPILRALASNIGLTDLDLSENGIYPCSLLDQKRCVLITSVAFYLNFCIELI